MSVGVVRFWCVGDCERGISNVIGSAISSGSGIGGIGSAIVTTGIGGTGAGVAGTGHVRWTNIIITRTAPISTAV